jgi:hypothetical protein
MYRSLSIDDKEILKFLYVREKTPTDQYKRRPEALRKLTDRFNSLTERNDKPDDLLHFMISQRKQGKWPKLGTAHRKLGRVPLDLLTADEWKILDEIYLDMNKGSDNYAYNVELRRELAAGFSARAGRFLPARTLCAALERRRKEGSLPRLTDKPEKPFGDIDAVAI